MVRKIELRVSLQQLVTSQKGPRAGRAAAGQAQHALWGRMSSSSVDIRDTGTVEPGELGHPLGGKTRGEVEDAKGIRRERRGQSNGGRALGRHWAGDRTAARSTGSRAGRPGFKAHSASN